MAQTVKCLPSMQETWVWSLGGEDPLEKEMTTHSGILAWKTPWMEKPGGLQSMGSQRVGHDWVTSLFTGYSMCTYVSLSSWAIMISYVHAGELNRWSPKSSQFYPSRCLQLMQSWQLCIGWNNHGMTPWFDSVQKLRKECISLWTLTKSVIFKNNGTSGTDVEKQSNFLSHCFAFLLNTHINVF